MTIKGCTKLLLSLGVCFGISACDIGPSGLSSGFEEAARNYEPPIEGETITVNGTVSKGLLLNGTVNIHPIVGTTIHPPIATGTTGSSNGSYSIEVNNYDNTPLLVRARTNDSTQMICDLPDGCEDGVEFGSTYAFNEPNFELDAITSPVETPVTVVNTSSLTHTAASVAIRQMNEASDTSATNIGELIRQANARVANRFGLTGSLTQLPVIDITNPTNLISRAPSQIEYNLINSSIIQSTRTNNPALSISEAIGSFAAQYRDSGGIADTKVGSGGNVTMAEILGQANRVVSRIQEIDTGNVVDLSNIQATIQANRQLAEIGDTDPRDGVVEQIEEDGELGKVIAMIEDLRKLGIAIDSGFEPEITMIENALDRDASHALAVLSMGADAIGKAIEAYDADDTIEQYEHVDSGITVNISSADDVVLYEIDQNVWYENEEVALTLNAGDSGSEITTGTEGNTESATADIVLSVTGEVSSPWVELDISEGSLTLSNFEGSVTETVDGNTETEDLTASFDTAEFDLDVVMTEGGSAADPVSFSGNLGFSVSGADLDDSVTETWTDGQWSEQFVSSINAESLNVYLSGAFSTTSGSLVNASVTLNSALTDYDPNIEETSEDYVDVDFAIILRVHDLDDISTPVTVTLNGSRTDVEDATVNLTIRYEAVTLNSSHTTTDQSETLVVTNHNEATLSVYETESGLTGNITVNGDEYASIDELNGIPTATYTDSNGDVITVTLW